MSFVDLAISRSRDVESDWTVKNDEPRYGLKEHASVDMKNGLVLATTLSAASVHDTKYLPYLTLASYHTEDPIKKGYADKGYYGELNRSFLHLNEIEDGIMRKDTTTAKITEIEVERNKQISKKRYIDVFSDSFFIKANCADTVATCPKCPPADH